MRAICIWLLTASAGLSGCGAQTVLLGTRGSYFFTAMDRLVPPGEEIKLQAKLEAGDFLRGRPGHVVRFALAGRPFKAVETDGEGIATARFTPRREGDYVFTARVWPVGLQDEPPRPQELLVACRDVNTPIAVVDLDKTLVASGFEQVLIGEPGPMAGSAEVMQRLAGDHTIVYLTHRPEHFGPKSKAWLRAHAYPRGPVLLSTVEGFLEGSGPYKSERLRGLTARYRRVEIGIGDKVSDARAYHENGLRSFLILPVPEAAPPERLRAIADELDSLPEPVQVVTGWDQIHQVLQADASFPRPAFQRELRERAARPEGPAEGETPTP